MTPPMSRADDEWVGQFNIKTASGESKECECANRNCQVSFEGMDTVTLEGEGRCMTIPVGQIGFCSAACAEEFAQESPYTDVTIDGEPPREAITKICLTLYVERIDINDTFAGFAIGNTPEELLENAAEVKKELLEKNDITIADFRSNAEQVS